MSDNEVNLVLKAIDSVKSELNITINSVKTELKGDIATVHDVARRVEIQANKTNGNVLDLQKWRQLVQSQINSVSKLLSFIDHTAIPNGIRAIIGILVFASLALSGWKLTEIIQLGLKLFIK